MGVCGVFRRFQWHVSGDPATRFQVFHSVLRGPLSVFSEYPRQSSGTDLQGEHIRFMRPFSALHAAVFRVMALRIPRRVYTESSKVPKGVTAIGLEIFLEKNVCIRRGVGIGGA